MARPAKQTVDYFPHRCKHGKTMFILETQHGDKGFTLWFKTLELLGSTDGHAYYFDNTEACRYFLAYCRVTKEQAIEILTLLAELGAIDKELWDASHIIWSDNFLEGIKDAYRNRVVDIPAKPVSNVRNIMEGGITDVRNPQTKLNYTKVNKTKESTNNLPDWIDKETWDAFLEMRKSIKASPTERAKELLIKKLADFKAAGDDPNAVLNQSTMNNWKGLFALKQEVKGNVTTNRGIPGNRPAGAFDDLC